MHRSVVSNRVVIIIVTMHRMELFSERTRFLIADRLALFHVFLWSIMLHSNKGTSRIYVHRYTDCLLKNASNKHTKYAVNQNLEQFDVQVSFRELFIRITVDFVLQSKIKILTKTRCLYLRWPTFL